MKRYFSSICLLTSLALAGCGQKGNNMASQGAANGSNGLVSQSSSSGAKKSLQSMQLNIQKNIPSLTAQAKSMGIKSAACPSGLDQECLDALFLAFVNTRIVKSVATFAQEGVGYAQSGGNLTVYNAYAQQSSIGQGFAITKSTYKQSAQPNSTPYKGAIGDVFLSNAGIPDAGIAAFGFLTDGSSVVGIAGGFAGANASGYVYGAFYCYLAVAGGTPTGACAALPVAEGGW